MLREQMINFLQAALVFLLLTNAASVMAAVYAIRIGKAFAPAKEARGSAAQRKIDALLRHAA
jgi:hypothetical protein